MYYPDMLAAVFQHLWAGMEGQYPSYLLPKIYLELLFFFQFLNPQRLGVGGGGGVWFPTYTLESVFHATFCPFQIISRCFFQNIRRTYHWPLF